MGIPSTSEGFEDMEMIMNKLIAFDIAVQYAAAIVAQDEERMQAPMRWMLSTWTPMELLPWQSMRGRV